MNQSKWTDLTVEDILSTGVSVKMQITDLISENLTNSDLESTVDQGFLWFNKRIYFEKPKVVLFDTISVNHTNVLLDLTKYCWT